MKWYLFITLMFAVAWVEAEEESDDLKLLVKNYSFRIKELVKQKCLKAGGRELLDKISTALDKADSCVEKDLPKEKLTNDVNSYLWFLGGLCHGTRPKLSQCFSDFTDLLKECTDEEENQYLHGFLFKVADSVLDFLCEYNEAISQKKFRDEFEECHHTFYGSSDMLYDCVVMLEPFLQYDALEFLFMKPEVCLVLPMTKACFLDALNDRCPSAGDVKDMTDKFFSALVSPCGANLEDPLNEIP